jgi:hypothetical protein
MESQGPRVPVEGPFRRPEAGRIRLYRDLYRILCDTGWTRRPARPGYDVAAVALSLGGGGHPQAAGCKLPGPMAEAEARVLPLAQAASINKTAPTQRYNDTMSY